VFLLLVASLALPLGGPTDAEVAPLVDAFLASFVRDDALTVQPFATDSVHFPAWQPLVNTLEALDCFTIASHRSSVIARTDDRAIVSLELHAGALSAGARRTFEGVPRSWHLYLIRVGGAWKIGHVEIQDPPPPPDDPNDPDSIATTTFFDGVKRWLADDVEGALARLETAVALVDRVRNPRDSIRASHLTGVIHERAGNVPQAIAAAEATLRLAKQHGFPQSACAALFILGDAHAQLRNFEVAQLYVRASLRCAEERQHHGMTAMALHNLAESAFTLDRQSDVVPLLRRAIALSDHWLGHDSLSEMHGLIGRVLVSRGDDAGAEIELLKSRSLARNIRSQRTLIRTLTELSELRRRQRRFDEALAFAEEGIRELDGQDGIGRTVSGEIPAWSPHTAAGRTLRALGRPADAERSFRAAIAAIEQRRARLPAHGTLLTSYVEDKATPYRELADLLVECGRAAEAVAVADQIKGRALRDLLESGRIDLDAQMSERDRQEEKRLVARLAELNTAIVASPESSVARSRLETQRVEARAVLDRFQTELHLRHPILRARAPAADDPLHVPPDELVLDYVVGDRRTIVFALRAGKVVPHVIAIRRADLEARVERLVMRIASRDASWRADAVAFYNLLVRPALDGSAKRICIIPDGPLWKVPFHALLLDRAAVYYAPSLGVRNRRMPRARSAATVLALGNPAVAGDLADAEEEVKEIGRLYASRSRVLTRRDAAEGVVKREGGRYDILHIAAHAVADDRRPMYSAVLLARDAGDDGFLEAREVLELDLDADLAVLAACSTGQGRIHEGEGLVSLAWAFLAAGSRSTVVSQWSAESRSTRLLMIWFHRAMRRGLSPAEAMREAQQQLRRDRAYRHPFYWAPFVVIGDP
jgi:CHAT domain-containing protein